MTLGEDFDILTICKKRIENFGHDLIFKKWDQLEVIYPGIDRPRNYVDKETGIELEMFILQKFRDFIFHIYTHTHFFEPAEEPKKEVAKLRRQGTQN